MKKQTFEKGDRVFDIRFGWGEVTYLYSSDWEKSASEHLVCSVKFDNGKGCHYTKNVALKSLSFTEYGFDDRFSQERPIDYEKCVGKWGKFWNKDTNDIVIDKLIDYYGDYVYESFKSRFTHYQNFEPLTEEQIKVLGLCN